MISTSEVGLSPERYALYYPYIHVRDENWLKATLLSFQQVRRIVPYSFTVKDQIITKIYSELEGPAGPLLQAAGIGAAPVQESQKWLETKIRENLNEIISRYDRTKTPSEWQGGPRAFEIHSQKILGDLGELLQEKSLAWHSRETTVPDAYDWLTVHPQLGAAIMTTIGLAIARNEGLDIVTPSERAHYALLTNREEQVVNRLLELPSPSVASGDGVIVEELAQIVFTTGFDLTRLNAQNICDLLKEGKDLRRFRASLARFASRIPPGLGSEERIARMKKEAEAVLEEWRTYSKGLPRFATKSLRDAVLDKLPDKAIEVALAATATTVASTVIGALPGLAISVVVAAGTRMYQKRNSPNRFLNRIERAVNKSIGSLYVPQWRELVGPVES